MIERSESAHAGWRSRGYLPHCDAAGAIQHIVFGLADALPRHIMDGLPATPEGRVAIVDLAFDEGHGERILLNRATAIIVEACLLHDDGGPYRLLAWCIMPNHVHVLAEQALGAALSDIVQTWKSVTAHRINHLLARKGALWRREYFDRFMRTDEQLISTLRYVEANPVAAQLVARAEEWEFSSARRRP